jgi:hypothetical protein
MTPMQMAEFEANLQDRDGYCYFADPKHRIKHKCTGKSYGMHLYPQSKLKQTFKHGAWKMPDDAHWRPMERYTPERTGMVILTLGEVCGDLRNGVAGCDGIHTPFDNNIDVRREAFEILPPDFKRFWTAYRLAAQIEQHFGLPPYSLEAK